MLHPIGAAAPALRVVDDGPELALGEFGHRADGVGVAQQLLGREDHERLPERPQHLAAEQVEMVRRRGRIGHLDVVAGTELQVPLHAAAGVLAAHALIAVWQEERQAVGGIPLVLPGGQELVDDDLRPVVEVAELGLPDGQAFRRPVGVAEIEAHDPVLAQVGVVDGQRFLPLLEVVQRNPLLLRVLGLDDGMAVTEGAALHILAADPDRVALYQQGAVGEQFAQAPVQAVLFNHGPAVLEELHDLPEILAVLGQAAQGVGQLAQPLPVEPGPHLHGIVTRLLDPEILPQPGEEVGHRDGLGGLRLLHRRVELALDLGPHRLGRGAVHQALGLELLQVELPGIRVLLDGLVELGLREFGLVALVVAILPVTEQVDEDVPVPTLAVFQGNPHRRDHRLGVVCVDVEDRAVRGLGDVRAVDAGPGVEVIGREAHLVVDHEVDRAAGAVAIELGHLDHLVDHTLAGHGRVAVHEDGHDGVLVVVLPVDAGAGDAADHRVHRFEVGGIRRQRDVDGHSGIGLEIGAVPHVVLHVAVEVVSMVVGLAGELLEDVGVGLVEDVREGVQAAAVRHADDELLGPELGTALHDGVQRGQQALPALHAEALLAHELLLEELLEDGRLVELLEDLLLLRLGQYRTIRELDVVLEPLPALRLADVHVFDADRVAIRLLKVGDDVAQGRCSDADLAPGFKHRIEVRFLQPEMCNAQVRTVVAPGPHRVGLGEQVAPGAVGVDQVDHPEFLGAYGRRSGR